MSKEKIINEFCEALETYGDWRYTESAVSEIVEKSLEAKQELKNILQNHPKWNEDNLMIRFDADIKRDIDINECDYFYLYLLRLNNAIFSATPESVTDEEWRQEAEKANERHRLINKIAGGKTQIMSDKEIDEANEIMKRIPETEKRRFNSGQKRSKAVSKIARDFGFDKDPDWQREFAAYGDAVNPMKVTRHTCISINPIDFLLSSNGDSWSTCHNINKEKYHGCNCSGVISYMLDPVTICMYTVDASYDGDEIEIQPKHNRMMIYMAPNFRHFVASKCYPDGTVEAGENFRTIFENVISECLDVPNLWVKDNDDLQDYITLGDNGQATCYEDWQYVDRNHICHVFHKSVEENKTSQPVIEVGKAPICVECGFEHSEKEQINCCHPFRERYCENCGVEVDYDDIVYSVYHDVYGCVNCMSYSDYSDDWFYNDEVVFVPDSGNHGEYVDIHALQNSGNFAYCDSCHTWHSIYHASETVDGYTLCENCVEKFGLVTCEECGCVGLAGNMIEADDGGYLCSYCAPEEMAKGA